MQFQAVEILIPPEYLRFIFPEEEITCYVVGEHFPELYGRDGLWSITNELFDKAWDAQKDEQDEWLWSQIVNALMQHCPLFRNME